MPPTPPPTLKGVSYRLFLCRDPALGVSPLPMSARYNHFLSGLSFCPALVKERHPDRRSTRFPQRTFAFRLTDFAGVRHATSFFEFFRRVSSRALFPFPIPSRRTDADGLEFLCVEGLSAAGAGPPRLCFGSKTVAGCVGSLLFHEYPSSPPGKRMGRPRPFFLSWLRGRFLWACVYKRFTGAVAAPSHPPCEPR